MIKSQMRVYGALGDKVGGDMFSDGNASRLPSVAPQGHCHSSNSITGPPLAPNTWIQQH